jgi:peptidoglycan/LPS O-acetylase OafA/YrhL
MQGNNGFSRNNNFNLVRIYLSLSVVFFHSLELSGEKSLQFINKLFDAEKAVEAFFIISGYLVMKSYYRSSSVKSFFIKRIKRIYPAYFVIILLCAAFGFLASNYCGYCYFTAPQLYKYIIANLFFLNFLQPSLPAVFENNLFTAVNGSLWTLKIEIGYYLVVPLIVYLRSKIKINIHLLYALLFLSSLAYYLTTMYLHKVYASEMYLFLSRQTPGQLFYFILGAWMTEIEKTGWSSMAIKWLGIPCMVMLFFPLPVGLQSILLAVVVFFCANAVPAINYPYKKEDFSYGVYIYHFPVIQLLVYYQVYANSAVIGLLWTLIITSALAIFSWFFIEKPFIVKKGRKSIASAYNFGS